MKKTGLIFGLLLLLASCSQDQSNPSFTDVGESVVHLSLRTSPMEVVTPAQSTRSTVVTDANAFENEIKHITVLQFKTVGGTLMKKSSQTVFDAFNIDLSLATNTGSETSNIYVVANMRTATFAENITETQFKTLLSNEITAESGFLLQNGNTDARMPMFGKCASPINVTANTNIPLNMVRLLARVDVTYRSVTTSNFSILRMRVGNIPKKIQYYGDFDASFQPTYTGNKPALAADTDVFATLETGLVTSTTANTLTFYLPENHRGLGSNTGTTDEKLKDGTGTSYATYIDFEANDNLNNKFITYRFYPGKDNYNDYNLDRNTKYSLTATLDKGGLGDPRRVTISGLQSNCYIIIPGSSINIPISRANESALGNQIANVKASGCTASIYWEAGSIIKTNNPATSNQIVRVENGGSCANGTFTVTGVSKGNAVVCIKNASGKILWSWHIWVSDVDFTSSANTLTTTSGGISYTWMDRNLGALDVAGATYATTAGMFYQWGRKDPFWPAVTFSTPGPATPMPIAGGQNILGSYTQVAPTPIGSETYLKSAILGDTAPFTYANQLALSVQFPALFLTYWAGSAATITAGTTAIGGKNSWNGDSFGLGKSVYDPCPVGWRVPSYYKTDASTSPWAGMAGAYPVIPIKQAAGYALFVYLTNGSYADWGTNPGAPINYGKYPAAGYRGGSGAFNYVGTDGYCWSGSVSSDRSFYLYFSTGEVNSSAGINSRACGLPVRCVQE